MILESSSSIWNLGDTSFRRKALINDYKILLEELDKFNKEHNEWNNYTQERFYTRVIENTDLIKKNEETIIKDDKKSKLARTYTNGIVKIGFCSNKRMISEAGIEFIKNDSDFKLDEFEKKLNLKKDNIIFLRQLLKLRIAKKNSKKSFNPFIFLIKLLNKYEYLTKEEFRMIIQLSNEAMNVEEIIINFKDVRENKLELTTFIDKYFIDNKEDIDNKKFITEDILDEESFKELFFNRKSSNSVKEYLAFYKILINYKDSNSECDLVKLIDLMKNQKIKKAFGTGEILSNVNKKHIKPDDFNEITKNIDIFRFNGVDFRKSLYSRFLFYKKQDLLNEYLDMTIRIFNTTGIISFANDKVVINNLYAGEYFKYIDGELDVIFDNDQDYIMKNVTINEILNLNYVEKVDELISKKYNAKCINEYILDMESEKFKKFIKENFDREKVIKILKNISLRQDNYVFKDVTDQTTIPTIFEYIIAIAWFHISKYNFDVYRSLNLTLDSSYYPLSHAPGGKGDIVIDYKDHKLMLEVTLMNKNNQKRGELEPVIRHSVNLTTENKDKEVYTIFIANELDINVINIFRACKYIKLYNSKNQSLYTNGTNILSLNILDIVKILENKIDYDKILDIMHKELSVSRLGYIDDKWKNNFMKKLLE